jgi:hypothetical protein
MKAVADARDRTIRAAGKSPNGRMFDYPRAMKRRLRYTTTLFRKTVLAIIPSVLAACGDDGGAAPTDTTSRPPQPLGRSCLSDAECISGVCLTSQYGTPFCTRACDNAWEACPGGDDLPGGEQALCLDMAVRPNPNAPAYQGELQRFCAPRCFETSACRALDAAWEACDVPTWLGDPLQPAIGNQKVCQSPSFHGKEPVSPSACDWERTVESRFNNEANLCRAYCQYMWNCKELESDAAQACCEWGCYNRIVVDGVVQSGWRDTARCYVDNHAAFPDTGPRNSCTEPPVACGGKPTDPTPAAAR